MPTPPTRRRLRWRRNDRGRGLELRIVASAAAAVAVLALATTALARPAMPAPAETPRTGLLAAAVGLLPSPTAAIPVVAPTVCVGGVVICGTANPAAAGDPAAPPPPCVAGVLLCSPVPLPSNPVIGPSNNPGRTPGRTPPPQPRTGPSGGRVAPGPSGPGGRGTGNLALSAPLPAPPGVGLVAAPQLAIDGGLAPGSIATVLSLSMRDGLASGRYHVWPWLLAAQLVLWTAIATVVRFRHSSRSPASRRP